MESPLVFDVDHDFKATGRYKYIEGGWNTGIEFGRLLPLLAEHPDFPPNKGYITAFDPLTGKTHWMREHSQLEWRHTVHRGGAGVSGQWRRLFCGL